MLVAGINIWGVCFRDIYDKMRADLRLMKDESQRIDTSRAPKVHTAHSLKLI